uniref:Reverse transcriptase Ty1/copia-type domain-containing protein n=1 Tax=Cannabis sativa TaxID=3483 RepID=A0A803QNV3_CANSA
MGAARSAPILMASLVDVGRSLDSSCWKRYLYTSLENTSDDRSTFGPPSSTPRRGRGSWNPYAVPPRTNNGPGSTSNGRGAPPPFTGQSTPHTSTSGVGAANVERFSANIATADTVADISWYPDSGATSHCTPNDNNFTHKEPYLGQDQIHMGDGASLQIQNVGRVYVSRDVIFNEHQFPYNTLFPNTSTHVHVPHSTPSATISVTLFPKNPSISPTTSPTTDSFHSSPSTTLSVGSPATVPESPTPAESSAPAPDPPINQQSMVTKAKAGLSKKKVYLTSKEPVTLTAALKDPKWLVAMQTEIKALTQNKTWVKVPLPPGRKAIGCKWVYKEKHNSNGTVNQCKARHTTSHSTFLLVYVDDILVTGSSATVVTELISNLNNMFALKDLGLVNYFLGIQVTHTKERLHMSQKKYIMDLLVKAKMDSANPLPTLMTGGEKLSATSSDPFADPTYYRSIVGALQYANITRPEISYAVNRVSQFMQTPLEAHWKTVKKILRYLNGTLDFGLLLKPSASLTVTGFGDADWASDLGNRRSISSLCVYLGSNVVSWSSNKQKTVSRSSTEAEYRSLAQTTAEVIWIQAL